MRIAVTSDIHIDKNGEETLRELVAKIGSLSPDVLVVAGDVATSPTTLFATLLALKQAAPEVVFVAGNHDVWNHPSLAASGQTAWWKLDGILPALCAEAGVHDLDAGPVVIDGVGFVGTLGWYDLSTRDAGLGAPDDAYARGEFAGLKWMDHVYACFPDDAGRPMHCTAVADRLRGRLAAQLGACPAERIVGVTHMVQFEEQLLRKAHPGWRFAQAFIGHLRLGELLRGDARVRLSVCGHTHHGSDHTFGSLRAVAAPLGYRHEWGGASAAEAVAQRVALAEL